MYHLSHDLFAGIGAAAGMAGAAGGIAKAANDKKHNNWIGAEAERHNKDNLLKAMKAMVSGIGAFL